MKTLTKRLYFSEEALYYY